MMAGELAEELRSASRSVSKERDAPAEAEEGAVTSVDGAVALSGSLETAKEKVRTNFTESMMAGELAEELMSASRLAPKEREAAAEADAPCPTPAGLAAMLHGEVSAAEIAAPGSFETAKQKVRASCTYRAEEPTAAPGGGSSSRGGGSQERRGGGVGGLGPRGAPPAGFSTFEAGRAR